MPKYYFAIVVCCGGLMLLTGCNVWVRGKQRPLISHERIHGDLTLSVEKYDDKRGVPESRQKEKTTTFEERLTLRTKGDVYNKNFLAFIAGAGFGLSQQHYSLDSDSQKSSGTLETYDLSLQFLRQKAYPSTLYFNRSDSLLPQQFREPLRVKTDNSGGSLALRVPEWPMLFRWSKGKTVQDSPFGRGIFSFEREDESFSYSVTHAFSEFSNLSIDIERNEVVQDRSGFSSVLKETNYLGLHEWFFGDERQHRLDSRFSLRQQSGLVNSEIFRWTERMELKHRENFSTNYSFGLSDFERNNITGRQIRGRVGFRHRLYESLGTRGDIFALRSDFGGLGKLLQKGGILGFSYRKKNPLGLLLSNYRINLLLKERKGAGGKEFVEDESHDFEDPFPIVLDKLNIDLLTIIVTNSDGSTVYTPDDDYTVTTRSDGLTELKIDILGSGGIIDGQTLLVDYEFTTEPQREEETLRQSFNIRQRFDNGVSVYYSHRRQDEKISGTVTTIVPNEFRINTFGVDYVKKRLRLSAEHSERHFTQSSSKSDEIEGNYHWILDPDTKVIVHASNHWLEFSGENSHDITLFNAGSTLFKRLSDKYNVSARVDYRDEHDSGVGNTKGLKFGVDLRYEYRLLTVLTGIEFNSLVRKRDKREGTYAYIRVRRLF